MSEGDDAALVEKSLFSRIGIRRSRRKTVTTIVFTITDQILLRTIKIISIMHNLQTFSV